MPHNYTSSRRLYLWLYFSVLCSFFVVGCGKENQSGIYDISIFQSYITAFETESIIYNRPTKVTNLKMYLSDLPEKTVGRCSYGDIPTIQINVKYWGDLSEELREILVFHELGHCILELDHSDNPRAIMYPKLIWGYKNEREKILAEFFGS